MRVRFSLGRDLRLPLCRRKPLTLEPAVSADRASWTDPSRIGVLGLHFDSMRQERQRKMWYPGKADNDSFERSGAERSGPRHSEVDKVW